MMDYLKFSTENQTIINRLVGVQGFERYQHRNNNYAGFRKYGKLMRLDFRKVFERGELVGFRHVEISISPHYHFNNYLHNGNDFTPENCIKTVSDILTYLGIEPQEYDLLKVVNIEFGLNIIPETDIKNLINWILYSKKTAFVVRNSENPYFKITDATKYKQIKAYAKGLHCHEVLNAPEIDINTFRFEVKSKKSANIKKYGIDTAVDLLKPETYQRLGQEIIAEWEHILLINQTPNFSDLKTDEVEFIQKTNERDFWNDLKTEKHRNTFGENKEKYYKLLNGKNNLHTQIKGQIIDKLIDLSKCAYFPQRNPINKGNLCFDKTTLKEINGQFAHFSNNNRLCLVSELDISKERNPPTFLIENDPENTPQNLTNESKEITANKCKCMNCEKSLKEKKANAKFCTPKCRKAFHEREQTKANQKKRLGERERLERVIKDLPKTNLSLLVLYRANGLQYADQLRQKEISVSNEWIRQIEKVLITGNKSEPPIEFTTLRAKKLIREIAKLNR